jgi:hypothetical protein
MKKIITGTFAFFALCIVLTSCWNLDWGERNTLREEAYVPVYGYDSFARKIASLPPQPTVHAGKIYALGNMVFQVDNDLGIHVINYSDRRKPVKIGFIQVAGCRELAIKNQYLMTNNLDDMVSIDIGDLQNVTLSARIQKAFNTYNNYNEYKRPPEKGKYFVCPEFYRGDVIGWRLEKKVYADCFNE